MTIGSSGKSESSAKYLHSHSVVEQFPEYACMHEKASS